MKNLEEQIVREYFERNGFLVRQLPRRERSGGKRTVPDEIRLLVHNPNPPTGGREPAFLLFSSELKHLARARVILGTGPSARFTPGALKSGTKLYRFLEKTAAKQSEEPAEDGPVTTVLVVPGLPTAEPFRSRAETLFKEKGIDALISFRSMLLDVIDRVEAAAGVEPVSEALEMLRLLKRYDLLNSSQMELFGGPPDSGRR